jgi:hypothetical protein
MKLVDTFVAIATSGGEFDAPIDITALVVVRPCRVFQTFFMVSGGSGRLAIKRITWQAFVRRSLFKQEFSAFGLDWLRIDGVSCSHCWGSTASHRLACVEEIMPKTISTASVCELPVTLVRVFLSIGVAHIVASVTGITDGSR